MLLSRFNPFIKLPNPREVWAWGMYDLANQSFTLIINTLLFAIFFKQIVVGDDTRGDSLWSIIYSLSMLLVVLISPLAGAVADVKGWRKRFLLGTGVVSGVLTCMLGLADAGTIALAIVIYIPANLTYQLGENFLASFLPSVSTPRTIGRISALGWTMGYIGALLLLIISIWAMVGLGWEDPASWRPLFVFAGLWFLLNMLPAFFHLREPPVTLSDRSVSLTREATHRLIGTARSAKQYRQLVRFLVAFFFFGMGVQVIVAFASILAVDFGFNSTKLVLFVAQLTVTAGLAAVATGRFQDKIGAKTTVVIYLVVWLISAFALLGLSLLQPSPEWMFWMVGNGIGFGLGGIGTAARSLVGRFTPVHKTAEFFGLWGTVYRLAGVVGVLTFGQVKAFVGLPQSLALFCVFFLVGLVLVVVFVNETAGVRAAKRAERDVALTRLPPPA